MLRFLAFSLIYVATATISRASEVVWSGEPTPAEWAAVAAAAGSQQGPLSLSDLTTAATRITPADSQAMDALGAVIEDVRAYETRLDGELVIMRDLQRPIDGIQILRDETDRDQLFKALSYQGFAVDRFFMDGLATKDAAGPFRETVSGLSVERPWVDAVALEPERDISPYDIAEAPQRVAYTAVRDEISRALPSTLVPLDFPPEAVLMVDGRTVTLRPTGGVRVPMGRHLVHALIDGVVVQRWDIRAVAGDEQTLSLDLPTADAQAWMAALWQGEDAAVPESLIPHLDALGGDVWLARRGRRGVDVIRVAPNGVERMHVDTNVVADDSQGPAFTVFGALNAGWLSNGNFALDAPNGAFTFGEVNAANLGLTVGGSYSRGLIRVGVGFQLAYTPGESHVARYGDSKTPFRTYPYLSAGIKPLQATFGYAFPHHPTAGLRSEIPLVKGIELQGTAWYGLGTTRARGAEDYQSLPLYAATMGLGYRL
ncbi:MAG: hypothetical protein ACJATT_004605 [Myxococcota bacterium]|jgi:hypothetical protein